tara:strand:- start:596 stop:1588 length:993 start_codon:yes stop_codon:yes gene_type:complete
MIRVGLIGMGIGQKHLEAIDGYRKCKVTSILEKNKIKTSNLKKKYKDINFFTNEKDFFSQKNLDLISIASYDEFHYRQVMMSIKNKCHIIVEKPVCLNKNQLKKIYNELKINPGIRFTSNLVLRKNSMFNEMKKKIKVRDVYHIDASYLWGRKKKLFQWRSKTKDYSLTLGATIHILDLVCWLLNSKPISVITKTNNKVTNNTKFKKFSLASYIFTFPNDIMVNLKSDGVCVHPHYHTIKIFEKNKTTISDLSGQLEIKKGGDANKFRIIKTKYAYPDKQNRGKFIREFLDSIIDNGTSYPSKKDIFELMTACFYADLSARYGKEIKIKY